MAKIAAVAGRKAPSRKQMQALLNSDFDPATWDAQMEAAFNDDYYAEAEVEAEVQGIADEEVAAALSPLAAPASVDESSDDGNVAGSGISFAQVHARVTGSASVQLPENDYGSVGMQQGGVAPASTLPRGDSSTESSDDDDNVNSEADAGATADAHQQASKDKVCVCVCVCGTLRRGGPSCLDSP